MALPKLYRAFNMKINCSSDIDFCHAKSFAWFVMRKMNKKCFLLLLLQILTSKRCIEWPKLYFLQSRTFGYENKAYFSGRPILSSRAVKRWVFVQTLSPFSSTAPNRSATQVSNGGKHLLKCPQRICWAPEVQSCSVLSYVNVYVSVFHDLLFSFRTGNVSLLLTLYAA